MAELKIPRAHSDDWYDNLASVQEGYFYPWQSTIGPGDGERAFVEMVKSHLTPDSTVLEVGCGHGELSLSLSSLCKKIIAYDRVPSYIALAKATQESRKIKNVEFLCHNAMFGAPPTHCSGHEPSATSLWTIRLGQATDQLDQWRCE